MFLNSSVRFWTSTPSDSISAKTILLYGNNSNIGYGSGDKEFGFCVRCLKNSELNSVEVEEIPLKF